MTKERGRRRAIADRHRAVRTMTRRTRRLRPCARCDARLRTPLGDHPRANAQWREAAPIDGASQPGRLPPNAAELTRFAFTKPPTEGRLRGRGRDCARAPLSSSRASATSMRSRPSELTTCLSASSAPSRHRRCAGPWRCRRAPRSFASASAAATAAAAFAFRCRTRPRADPTRIACGLGQHVVGGALAGRLLLALQHADPNCIIHDVFARQLGRQTTREPVASAGEVTLHERATDHLSDGRGALALVARRGFEGAIECLASRWSRRRNDRACAR